MKTTIMVVDDNPDLLFMIDKGLKRIDQQYEIITANSGKECLKKLENNEKPDIILLDIMMPEMNGWDVLTKIREKPSYNNIPIVFLTAKTDNYSKGFGLSVADDFIEKPFELKELNEKIKKIVGV